MDRLRLTSLFEDLTARLGTVPAHLVATSRKLPMDSLIGFDPQYARRQKSVEPSLRRNCTNNVVEHSRPQIHNGAHQFTLVVRKSLWYTVYGMYTKCA